MNAYSIDLRRKMVKAVSIGTPKDKFRPLLRRRPLYGKTLRQSRAERGEDLTPHKPPSKWRKLDTMA